MNFIKGFLLNLQFFTAIPINMEIPMDKKQLRSSIQTIPLLGLFQGIVYSSLLYVLIHWTPFSYIAIAFLVWLLTIILTGGLHLDGWMDTWDAYFSYKDKEKRLKIMSDPHIGAFGVLSIIILLSARFLFIYEIVASLTYVSYIFIALIPFFSKSVMGSILVTIPSAKKEGLAAFFRKGADTRTLIPYIIYLIVVFVCLYKWLISLFIIFIVSTCCYFFIKKKSKRWFGGITGDLLGASVEGTELLLWMTLWLLHYFAMV